MYTLHKYRNPIHHNSNSKCLRNNLKKKKLYHLFMIKLNIRNLINLRKDCRKLYNEDPQSFDSCLRKIYFWFKMF